jgi:hypothetical protein
LSAIDGDHRQRIEIAPCPDGAAGGRENRQCQCYQHEVTFHQIHVTVNIMITQEPRKNADERRELFRVWLTEIQAIAIYKSEISCLRRLPRVPRRRATIALCERILLEEFEHSDSVGRHLRLRAPDRALAQAYRGAGVLLGWTLSVLPARLSWKVHAWAERQAARVYADAFAQMPLRELWTAHEQELNHAALFEQLLNLQPGMIDGIVPP